MEFGPVIKNPVLDINKLVRQGTMLNQSVQTVEGDLTADQATTDLLAKKDPVIHEISVGISGEEASLYTVSGTPPLSLPNSLGKPLKAWSVEVSPYQEGTGDPSPSNVRPIHGTDKLTITTAGVNLLNIVPQSGSSAGIDYSVDNDGYITLNGTNSSACNIYLATHIPPIPMQITLSSDTRIANGIYTGLVKQNGSTGLLELRPSQTQTTSSESGILEESRYRIYITEGNSYSNFKFRIMLNFGTTALPYTPYIAPSQTDITLPSTVYTATIGSGGGESRWGEVDLGTLNWQAYSSGANTSRAQVSGKALGDSNILTDIYATRVTAFSNMDNCTVRGTSENTYIYVRDDAYTDVTSFKQSITGHKLIYELETLTTFAVPSPTIPTPTGTATTWATAEDGILDSMEVTYVGKA